MLSSTTAGCVVVMGTTYPRPWKQTITLSASSEPSQHTFVPFESKIYEGVEFLFVRKGDMF